MKKNLNHYFISVLISLAMIFNRLLKTFLLLFLFISLASAADKFTVSGTVIGPDGEPKKKVKLTFYKNNKIIYKLKTNEKGSFKIKKVLGGEYSLQVLEKKDVLHTETLTIIGDLEDLEIKLAAASSKTPVPYYYDVIHSVDFMTNDNNQMIISFYFSQQENEDIYNIEILVSDNNGKIWFSPKTVSGDVREIGSYGKKEVIWDIFSDVDELDGDVIIDVKAYLVNDSYYSQDLMKGNNYIKQPENQVKKPVRKKGKLYRRDGLKLKVNLSRIDFLNSTYKKRLSEGDIMYKSFSGGSEPFMGVGFSLDYDPIIFYYDVTYSAFTIKLNDSSDLPLVNESIGTDDDEMDIYHIANDIGISIVIFPEMPLLSPVFGLGLQFSRLKNYKYEEYYSSDVYYDASTTDLYAKGGVTISYSSISLDLFMKKSLIRKERAWEQLQIDFGINICYSL